MSVTCTTAKELGKALKNGPDCIIIEGSLAVVYKLAKIIDKKTLKILCFEHIKCGYLTYSIR